jgi:hypothetical protein
VTATAVAATGRLYPRTIAGPVLAVDQHDYLEERENTMKLQRLARTAVMAAMFGIALAGIPGMSVHAEPIGKGGTQGKVCYVGDIPYLPGETATFSSGGQPAKQHTCQKDGTWSALIISQPIVLPVAPLQATMLR